MFGLCLLCQGIPGIIGWESEAVSRASYSSWPAIRILMGLYWVMGPAGESCPCAIIMVVGVLFSQWSFRASVERALLTQLPWLPLSSNPLVTVQSFRFSSVISTSTKCRSAYSASVWVSESLVAAEEGPAVTLGCHRFPIAAPIPSSPQLP